MRDPRHDILFSPLQIGPKTAKNRFYQVPHCNGGGYRDPSAVVEMRRTKAEGGWGVIFTEQTEIHPTSEITPFIEQHLWDDRDLPALCPHGRGDEIPRRACRHPAGLLRHQRPEPLQPRGPAGRHRRPDPDLHLRPRPGPHDGQGGHPQPPPLVPQCLPPQPAGGLRPHLPLRRAWLRHPAALPLPRHQPPHRRIRRQPHKPGEVSARDR